MKLATLQCTANSCKLTPRTAVVDGKKVQQQVPVWIISLQLVAGSTASDPKLTAPTNTFTLETSDRETAEAWVVGSLHDLELNPAATK
jgi:hypothetical protein